jgi:hypothetical protein
MPHSTIALTRDNCIDYATQYAQHVLGGRRTSLLQVGGAGQGERAQLGECEGASQPCRRRRARRCSR